MQKTSVRGWAAIRVLIQNCKMTNAATNSSAVVLIENGIPGAALEGGKPAILRRGSLSSIDLVVWAPVFSQPAAILSTAFKFSVTIQ